jgi:lipoic acid synthetase
MKPAWLKKKLAPSGLLAMKEKLRGQKLHSVCEEAKCPNISECFSKGVATVMIMGDTCTRACKFCAVKTGRPDGLDPIEPLNTAKWVRDLDLKHIVITSVDRDDLKDLGANHFAETILETRKLNPEIIIEVLTPDFQGRGECLDLIGKAHPEIFNHNIETTRSLTSQVRSASNYDRSLKVIQWIKENYPKIVTKSGIMLGLGETKEELIETMEDLVTHQCDLLTLGQYLQPTKKHLEVKRFIPPEEFDELKQIGLSMGFKAVFSGPFVRSSYLADELFGEFRESIEV